MQTDNRQTFETLLAEIRRDCGWETFPREKIPRLAPLCGPAEVDRLIRELDALDDADLVDDAGDMADEYWRLRNAYSGILTLVGQPAVEPLLGALASSNLQTRAYAAEALGAIRDPRAFEPIAALLADPGNDEIKTNLIRAFGYLHDERAVELLLPFLKTREQNRGHVIAATAEALATIGTESVVAPLASVLANDPDWYARHGAAQALRRMSHRSAREALRVAANDPDERVRWFGESTRRAATRWRYLVVAATGLILLAAGILYGTLDVGVPGHGHPTEWIAWSLTSGGIIAVIVGLVSYVMSGLRS